MLTLLILLGMAYAQDNRNFDLPAYVWASMFAVIHLVIGIFGGAFLASLVVSLVLGLYAWGYFALLRHVSDQTLLWLLVCVLGLVFPILLSATLMP